MDIKVEVSRVTDEVVVYKVSTPAPRIVDTSNWPHFTVEWMGVRTTGKWLSQDSFQIGNRVFFRMQDEDCDVAVVVPLAELLMGVGDV